MLAFPGEDTGKYALRAYAPSKDGKSWYRTFGTREAAIASKRELVDAGIGYLCKKVEQKTFPRHRSLRTEEFGGRLNAQPIAGSWRRRSKRA